MSDLGKKISALPETTDLNGLYTIGTDKNTTSKKVSLQFLKEAANYANAQGDYAKNIGDTVAGNVGSTDYPVFSASGNYAIGDVVRYNDRLYRFTAPHQAGSWTGADVEITSINEESQRKLTELESKVTIPFDYEDRFINPSGSLSDKGGGQWWITGYIAIQPNSRIRGKVFTQSGVLCVAFFDSSKNYIGGIEASSSSREWESYDIVAPNSAYYVMGCTFRGSDLSKNGELIITPPLDKNELLTLTHDISEKVTIPFDYEDRFINTDGTLSLIGTKTWWITGFVAISPNSRIRGKVFTQSGVLCVAFYDEGKNFISGVESSSSSSSRVWENIDTIAPSDAYYMVACTYKGIDLSINGEILCIYPAIDKNILIGITDSVEFDKDGYIDESGIIHETTSWKSTDFIKVQGGQRVIGSVFAAMGATALIAMYDRYFNFLQSVAPQKEGMNSLNIIIPNNVHFVRLTTKANTNAFANFTAPIFTDNNDFLKYGHSLNKPYDFNGKRAVFFGDSVTNGVASQGGTIIGITDCYRKVFCDKAGLAGINKAISGSYLYCPDYDGTPNEDSILSQVRNTITSETAADFDFVVVAGGINDFWTGKNLGTLEDEGNVSVYGALKAICAHLKANIPNAKVIFLTPINYSKMQRATPYLPLSHYRNAIFEVATMNGYSVVDMSVIGFPNEPNDTPYKDAMITDGVHPTALGHRMMGENLYSILC